MVIFDLVINGRMTNLLSNGIRFTSTSCTSCNIILPFRDPALIYSYTADRAEVRFEL